MKNTVDIKEVNRTQFYSFYVLLIFKFNIKFSPISFLTKPEYQTNSISLNDNLDFLQLKKNTVGTVIDMNLMNAYPEIIIMLNSKSCQMSFSFIKKSVLYPISINYTILVI